MSICPACAGASGFLQTLRERTLVAGYQAASEMPQRFRGILAPSISHEGYPSPTHSYWDDYWALKGWHDGAWLARQWRVNDMATWAADQETALRDSMATSIRATMDWKHIDYVPASADFGDPDPTSVSIALDPCGQQELLPDTALHTTFTRYLDDVRKRALPGARYVYSPYEFRNVLTFVHLDEPLLAEELNRCGPTAVRPLRCSRRLCVRRCARFSTSAIFPHLRARNTCARLSACSCTRRRAP